tara:strand:- start:417 stop:818 length:402 start_codon:yes stop_codon:yes gene_type:complete
MFNIDDLNDEEKVLWEKMSGKLEKSFQQMREDNVKKLEEQSSNPEIFQDPENCKHVTTYPREILIKLSAELSTVSSETNQLLELDTIVENFYHIPVPSGANYLEKIDSFLDKFDVEVEDVAIKINTNDKQEKE